MTTPRRPQVCRPARLVIAMAVGAAVGAASTGLTGCSGPTAGLTVVGTVDDSVTVVALPAMAMPSVDLNAGFPSGPMGGPSFGAGPTSGDPGSPGPTSRPGSPVLSLTGLGGVWRIATTAVREGARVTAGQIIATVDDGILAAQVRAAEASAATAAATVRVVEDRIAEVDDKHRELTEKRSQLTDALATISATRSTLAANRVGLLGNRAALQADRASLVSTRAGLIATKERLSAVLATLPTDPSVPLPPGTPTRAEVTAQLAAVASGISSADAGLAKIDAGLATMSSGLATMEAGLAQLTTKAATVRTGLATIATGRSALAEARTLLGHTRSLARIAVDTAGVGVALAREQQALATIAAPVAGVVVTVSAPGDLVAAGAVLATIRPDGPATVRAWLGPEQSAGLCVGDPARVRGDWMAAGADVAARVSAVGDRADYPPSATVTDDVHLTRAVPVNVRTAHDPLPAGVPVQITLMRCR